VLLSMTGHGEARCEGEGLTVSVELRTINSRFVKISVRTNEGYNGLEPLVEGLLRQKIRRGTVQASIRVARQRPVDDYQINVGVLEGYRRQLAAARLQCSHTGSPLQEPSLDTLLLLPGVVDGDSRGQCDVTADWPAVEKAVAAAAENLDQMRAEEGRAMAADMHANCRQIETCLDEIRRRAPLVIEQYRKRLLERVEKILSEHDVALEAADVLREITLFAERSDISEEVVRLASHIEQFDTIAGAEESSGRKLEFLIQEMFRETNTIGSKSYDVEIARQVIEIKTAIERLREMIQNVE